MKKSYDDWWKLIETVDFDKALDHFSWQAQGIIRQLFYKEIEQRRTNEEIADIEHEYYKALRKYEEKFKEPFNFHTWYDPYEALYFYDAETREEYQSYKILQLVILFLTVKELYEYVVSYNSLTINKRFSRFKEISFLISNVYTNIVADLERKDEKIVSRELITIKARKAGKAKQSPYEKAGTINAVFTLLEEKSDILQKRGGKAELIRSIIRKIERSEIPAPDVPTERTIQKWIADWQQKSAR
ncbi:hypothetical protein [Neisseria sp. S1]|uniref:hypothetical protein n=1 Tax=Neisseria sp. S1 TaxID=3318354 RepID=UPI003A8636F9